MEDMCMNVPDKIPFTPRRNRLSGSRSGPCSTNFDRFIPYRPDLDIDTSYTKLITGECPDTHGNKQPDQYRNHQFLYYNQLLDGALNKRQTRILPTITRSRRDSGYSSPISPNASFFNSALDDAFSSPPKNDKRRRVATWPECVMDAPKFRNDYYTNLLDWGSTNMIAVALSMTTYIWNAETKVSQKLGMEKSDYSNCYIASVAWNPKGTLFAIGDNMGTVMICDPENAMILRRFHCIEKSPIGVMRWTEDGIFSGTRHGHICLVDPRVESHVALFEGNFGDTCGLQKAEGTPYLASGDDAGVVCIWNVKTMTCCRTIRAHTACAKAMSFCPWRNSILATGGGYKDGYIRLWHIHTGQKLGELYTKSQNCSLLWSEQYRELVSSHGTETSENNDIVLWKMRDFNMEPVARLQQHTARPLHMALSPDKTTIASVGADELLCLWKCFPMQKEVVKRAIQDSPLSLDRRLR